MILGVELDSMLSFKDHITKQLQKVYAKSGALRKIRRFVPGNVMLRLYKTFILPHFEYCCPLFLGLGKVQANRLEDANYYILRSLLGYLKSTLYDELLRILNMETLDQRRKQQYLILLYKCLHNDGPKYIRDFFSFRETMDNLRGTGINLCAPKFNLNFMKKSFTYMCAQLWNGLPTSVKLANDINLFKKLLRTLKL